MLETLQNAAAQMLTALLQNYISALLAPLQWALGMFAQAGALRDLTTQPWAQNLIAGAQGMAAALLALRVAWEALQMATLRAEGAPTDPGALLKRSVMAGAAIFAGPWAARQMLVFGNGLATAVARAGLGVGLEELDLASLVAFAVDPFRLLVLLLPAVVLGLLIFFQAMIRTVEITLAAIISPLAALGYVSGGGMADVWWREVVVLSTAQAVQMLLLYLATVFLATPTRWDSSQFTLGPFLFVATLWVAWRTPHILRNYAYSSGVSGGITSVGQVAMWRVMARLPF